MRKWFSKLPKWKKRLYVFAFVTSGILIFLNFFPFVYYPYSTKSGRIVLHSFSPLPAEINAVLSIANDSIANSEIISEGPFCIYLCPNRFLFGFSAFLAYNSFAVFQWNSVFVAHADVTNNLAHSLHPANNKRTLSGVISHEIGHFLLANRFGAISHRYFLPTWKVEGYCDYLAKESSFDQEEGEKRIVSGIPHDSASFNYFLWRKRIQYLIEVMKMDLNSVFREEFVVSELDEKVSQWVKEGRTKR